MPPGELSQITPRRPGPFNNVNSPGSSSGPNTGLFSPASSAYRSPMLRSDPPSGSSGSFSGVGPRGLRMSNNTDLVRPQLGNGPLRHVPEDSRDGSPFRGRGGYHSGPARGHYHDSSMGSIRQEASPRMIEPARPSQVDGRYQPPGQIQARTPAHSRSNTEATATSNPVQTPADISPYHRFAGHNFMVQHHAQTPGIVFPPLTPLPAMVSPPAGVG